MSKDQTNAGPNSLELWLQSQLKEIAKVGRSTRAGAQPEGFDAGEFAQADVLSVVFSDGSVLHTRPDDFVARYASSATAGQVADARSRGPAAAVAPGTAIVMLPFDLAAAGSTRAAGAGTARATVEFYSIAKLTQPGTLDQIYQIGAVVGDTLDRWFGGSPAKSAPWLAAKLCNAYENSVLDASVGNEGGRLLIWQSERWVPATSSDIGSAQRALIFLHGTASSTAGSFGALWEGSAVPGSKPVVPSDFRTLALSYDAVLGWEHRSLTLSPVDNVIGVLDALASLPSTCELDMVSHSRGGMVGELMCLAAEGNHAASLKGLFSDVYGEGHADAVSRPVPDGAGQMASSRLDTLFQMLASGPRFRLGTFVRVACPARGTLLADRRTDFFLSLMLRSIGLAFGVNGVPLYERFNGLVRALVAARADAASLPGLEAMIPGSPLTLALNGSDYHVPGRLRVIAGDSEGSGWGGLKTLVGDLFYGLHDHDFVVHTHSMFGGFARTAPLSLRLADKSVTHFSYFKLDALARRPLLGALAGRDDGWQPLAIDERNTRGLLQALNPDPLSLRPTDEWVRSIDSQRPVLVVLPGIMGSELALPDDSGTVWLSLGSMLNGNLEKLDFVANPKLPAGGLVALSYERLLREAGKQFNVVTLPYDWRQPIGESAKELSILLAKVQDAMSRTTAPGADHPKPNTAPIHLFAHSMGGLVARAALLADPALWNSLKSRGGRFLMLGTPNRGSHAPVMLLLQQHRLSEMIARLARKVTPKSLADWGRHFQGLMEMLPHEPDDLFGDWFDLRTWEKVAQVDRRASKPTVDVLAAAGKFRKAMSDSFEALKGDSHVLYVAGQGDTPVGLIAAEAAPWTVDPDADGARLGFGSAPEGDGTVAWNSALSPERTWYAPCGHGDLADHTASFDAYFELLASGNTQRLPRQPAQGRRNARGTGETKAPLRALPVARLPSLPADPLSYVLDLRADAPAELAMLPIEVRMVHGSLDYARFPLIVGHYLNEQLVGGSRRVDEKLGGKLQRMVDLHLFEGAVRTAIYLRPRSEDSGAPSYPGAVVLGLGAVGELTPSSLADTVTRGVLRFAFEHVHVDPFVDANDPVQLRLSTLLVGTHVQAITPRDSLSGVLNGLWRAAQVLARGTGIGRPVQLVEVEIIEIEENVALDAAYELRKLLDRAEWRSRVHWAKKVLEIRDGGLSGYRPRRDDSVWQRLVIQQQPGTAGLHYSLNGERARVESTRTFSDVTSLGPYIARVSNEQALAGASDSDGRGLGRVLFQLLLPQDLKSRIANFENTVLVLDDDSAMLPWELLTPPARDGGRSNEAAPLATQAGLIRQRSTEEFRRLPSMSDGWDALIVGEPCTEGWTDALGKDISFASLPGALREAEDVNAALAADGRPWTRTNLTGPTVTFEKVRTALLEKPYRLLHLCGHGVVDHWVSERIVNGTERRASRKTGMVLSHQQILTAADVEQMDPVPEFVFINCCYSAVDANDETGHTQNDRNYPVLAASLALQFIRMGSKAVVAAGWQIEDQAGQAFAESLYKGVLEGEFFGMAVQRARQDVRSRFPTGGNTWGAYQCYGDPQWRLHAQGAEASGFARSQGSSRLRGAEFCMSQRELAQRVMQVVALAGDKPSAELIGQLVDLEGKLEADEERRSWLQSSLVQAAFGEAYRELGAYRQSLEWCQRAAGAAYSKLQLRQVELMVNSLSRIQGSQEGAAAHAAAAKLLELLDTLDEGIRAWPPTTVSDAPSPSGRNALSEHECLQGSDLMRQAATARSEDRVALLHEAAGHFERGYLGKCEKPRDSVDRRAFALSNALLASALADIERKARVSRATTRRAGLLAQVPELISDINAENLAKRFWHYTNTLDLLVAKNLRCVADGGAASEPELMQADRLLRRAMERWPSPSEHESLEYRFKLILEVLRGSRGKLQARLKPLAAFTEQALQTIAHPPAERR